MVVGISRAQSNYSKLYARFLYIHVQLGTLQYVGRPENIILSKRLKISICSEKCISSTQLKRGSCQETNQHINFEMSAISEIL